MYKIMIVEDDEKISQLIKLELEKYNYQVVEVKDYERVLDLFKREEPDLLLIDINLPKYDGFYWCKEIRKISKLPIIYVSARFSDMDQVMAIEKGGDDYIVKPFSFEILLAKIKSLLRRSYGEYRSSESTSLLEVDGLKIFRDENIVEYREEKIELSHNEFKLLDFLLKNINKIVAREELLEALWDDIDFVDDNTLSVNITRLRKQLARLEIEGAIKTKRGQGYKLVKTWGG